MLKAQKTILEKLKEKLSRAFMFDPLHLAVLTVILLVSWLPIIILMLPTSFAADTVAQILWARGYPAFDPSSRELLPGYIASDHHPYLDTLIYGAFDWVGHGLFQNDAIGYMLYGACQSVLTAFSLMFITCYVVDRLKVPKAIGWVALAFYALVPVFAMHSQVIVKDLTSMPFFIFWMTCYLAMLKQACGNKICGQKVSGRGKVSGRVIAGLIVFGILAALMRKTLIYVELLALLIALFIVAGNRIKVLATMLACVVVVSVFVPKVVLPALNVAPGGAQEALAVPAQQTTKALIDHYNEMSKQDIETISKVLNIDVAKKNYSAASADPVKDNAVNRNASTKDKIAFLFVWFRQGFSFPMSYIHAIAYQRNLYLYTADVGKQLLGEFPSVRWGWDEYGGNDLLPNYPAWNGSTNYPQTNGQQTVWSYLRNFWGDFLPLSIFVRCPTYTFLLPIIALFLCLWKRNKRAFIALMPLFVSLCVIFMAPAALGRYAYNCFYLAPLFIALPFSQKLACQTIKVFDKKPVTLLKSKQKKLKN